MSPAYSPPYSLTSAIVSLVSQASEALGWLCAEQTLASSLRLRRINRIRTIQGSLAIEGNTLGEAQIPAILDGKRVLAPPREIQEARNAIKAYELFSQWQPAKELDLLAAHSTLMAGLLDAPGHYRNGGVGVMAGTQVIHMAPPASRVPLLMHNLLSWLSRTDEHPLIASSVFHYEFEFIHPFDDGNGRMGRLWQTLILSQWNPALAYIPVESLVHEHQAEYYQAINQSTQQGNAAPFITFMLQMLVQALAPQVSPQVTPQVRALIAVLEGEMNREQLQALLALRDRKSFRQRYLQPALAEGLIEYTRPDQPNSRLQQYRLTDLGQALRSQGRVTR